MGTKIKPKFGRSCVKERGLWLRIASVRYTELFRIFLSQQDKNEI